MSNDAHTPSPAGRPEPGERTGATSTEPADARPRMPRSTLSTDPSRGRIRVHGAVDGFGADLLCRSVAGLQQMGHREITVELTSWAVADDEARARLARLEGWLAGIGVRLVLR